MLEVGAGAILCSGLRDYHGKATLIFCTMVGRFVDSLSQTLARAQIMKIRGHLY